MEEMLDAAIAGGFLEKDYDETCRSAIESRMAQYLKKCESLQKKREADQKKISTLISDISHQTKTPLANIILYSELLKEQPLTEEGEVIAEQLHVQAEKLEFLIKALVKMSRLESDILEVVPVKQPLRPLVENAIRDAKAHAQEKSITILEPGFDSIEAVLI